MENILGYLSNALRLAQYFFAGLLIFFIALLANQLRAYRKGVINDPYYTIVYYGIYILLLLAIVLLFVVQ
jgi:hypothetical protein